MIELPSLNALVKIGEVEGKVIRTFGDALVIETHGGTEYVTADRWESEGGIVIATPKIITEPGGYL